MTIKNGVQVPNAPGIVSPTKVGPFKVVGQFIELDEGMYVLASEIQGVVPAGTLSPMQVGGQQVMMKKPGHCIVIAAYRDFSLARDPKEAAVQLSQAMLSWRNGGAK